MTLVRIEVEGFRNLQRQVLSFESGVNLFWGDNGSGKTSLLEAIYFLARGRSFKRARSDQLIQNGCQSLTLAARIEASGQVVRLAMQRTAGRTRVRLAGREIWSLSEIAWLLPIHLINTESQRVFGGAPQERRSLIDWGLFHVEQGYQEHWRRFQRALKQRNAAIQSGDPVLAKAWEANLVAAGEAVDDSRRRYLDALSPYWRYLADDWLPGAQMHWEFHSGWPQRGGLRMALSEARAREMERGHTLHGPHRSDLRFRARGVDAAQHLSGGQQKLAAIAFRLAQAELTGKRGVQRPIILFDDLGAELDAGSRGQVLERLQGIDAQIFLTALSRGELALTDSSVRVFHVEQGRYCSMV